MDIPVAVRLIPPIEKNFISVLKFLSHLYYRGRQSAFNMLAEIHINVATRVAKLAA